MRQTRLVCAIAFALASIADYPKQVQAQLTEPNNNVSESVQLADFQQPPPPDDAPDGRRRGTGSRGDSEQMIPLVPSDYWGYTTSDSPIIWVYVEYPSGKSAQKINGTLSLQDPITNKEILPNISVTLPQESAIFPIRLPPSYSLPPNRMYRWYLALDNCGNFVDGWVRRVEDSELQRQVAEAKTGPQRYDLYAQKGIWYDILNEAAKIRCNMQNPSIDDPLAKLLKNQVVDLESIAQVPVICM